MERDIDWIYREKWIQIEPILPDLYQAYVELRKLGFSNVELFS
jgi:hypothetical protein